MQNRRYLLMAILFSAIVAGALASVAVYPLPSIGNILMFLVGLFAMAALSAFQRLLDTAEPKSLVQITFNEYLASTQLSKAAERAGADTVDADIRGHFDVSPAELLGRDNSLALAKLRIDIERELRQIASASELPESIAHLGPLPLTQELANRGLIDPAIIEILNKVVGLANQAIHGKEVSTDTASTVIKLGGQLLAVLHAYSEGRRPT